MRQQLTRKLGLAEAHLGRGAGDSLHAAHGHGGRQSERVKGGDGKHDSAQFRWAQQASDETPGETGGQGAGLYGPRARETRELQSPLSQTFYQT